MAWLRSFPYKWQVAGITLGVVNLVSASVFFLISRGLTSSLWIIMSAIFLSTGVLCSLSGAIWCCVSIRHVRREHSVYGRFKDSEAEMLTGVDIK